MVDETLYQVKTQNHTIFNRLKLHMLGSPEIIWLDQPYEIARRQARALLYLIGSSFPQPITRSKLAFLIWSDKPDQVAGRNLNRMLSYLHNSLPNPDILQIKAENIQLDHNLVWVDIEQFSRLSSSEEIEFIEAAITLYTGPFLDGFSLPKSREFNSWLNQEQRNYENLFSDILNKVVQKFINFGQYQDAIPYAMRSLQIDNLAEETYRQLITCYAAIGDRGSVQKIYEDLVLTLERELGVTPLPETKSIYESSIKGEIPVSEIIPVHTTWSTLPSLKAPLIGRETDWIKLNNEYGRLRSGGAIFVSGEAGVGKTRFLQEFTSAQAQFMINGNAHPYMQDLPFYPLLQGLRQLLNHQKLWEGISKIWLGELSRLLPELHSYFKDLPEPISLEPQNAQSRILESISRILLGIANNTSSLFLCIDDLHWADEYTLNWLKFIASRLSGSHLFIFGIYRDELASSVQEIRRTFRRSGVLAELQLTGLSKNSVEELIRHFKELNTYTPKFAIQLHKFTGGNPFYLLETMGFLMTSEFKGLTDEIPLSPSLQDVVQHRLGRLDPISQQILQTASVLSPEISFNLLTKTSGRKELEVIDSLDDLEEKYLLLSDSSGYRFHHELIRSAVYQGISPWRRSLLHRRAGNSLGTLTKKDQQAISARMAFHYDQAGSWEQAIQCYQQAATEASRVYAHKTAITYLSRAIAILPEMELDDSISSMLYEALADNQELSGQLDSAINNYQISLESVAEGEPIRRANLYRKMANALMGKFCNDESAALFEKALNILGQEPPEQDPIWFRTWLDVQLDRLFVFYQLDRPLDIIKLADVIHPVLEEVGEPIDRIKYIAGVNGSNFRQQRFHNFTDDVLENELTALKYAEEIGEKRLICERKFRVGMIYLLNHELEQASFWLNDSLSMARKYELASKENQSLAYMTVLHRIQGDVEQVKIMLPSAIQSAKAMNNPNYIGTAFANQAWLAYRLGDLENGLTFAQSALDQWESTHTYPFQWTANLVILAISKDQGDLLSAVQASKMLIAEDQQLLPDDVDSALKKAIMSWDEQHPEKTSYFLTQAIDKAQKIGYI